MNETGKHMQTTIKSIVRFAGTGLHQGRPARLSIHPAPANHGIWFRRTDIEGNAMIAARHDAVELSPLCTLLVNEAGVSVSTVEHVMAALSGCGVLNAILEIDGPEVPILDGSAAEFVRAIDFVDAAIGQQHKVLRLSNGTFVRELCDSRTFCSQSDVDAMRAAGKALGGSLSNAVVVDGARVLNPEGLRHIDEAVRHKMLDALGDLALAGAPILGRYTGIRAGHAVTNKLLRALFADPLAYRIRTLSATECRLLPGAGLERDVFSHI